MSIGSASKGSKVPDCGELLCLRFAKLYLFPAFHTGKTGDWKTMFTDEQNHHFKRVYRTRMKDCSLKFVWGEQDEEELCAKEQIPLSTPDH